ncbi:potassium-transporting ATPase subunit F [Streptacidiphilus sp. EB129]|jgi:K+-transporting ATPase KdpF subunit
MSVANLVGLLVAGGLVGYLVLAIRYPEKF